jgi:hypothetical protein
VIRLFRVFIPASVVALLFSEIILITGCYVVALFFLGYDPSVYLFEDQSYWKLVVVVGTILLGLYFQDLYGDLRITSNVLLVQQVCLSVGLALLISAFIGYIDRNAMMGRSIMMLGSMGVVLLLPLWRVFFWRYVISALRSERVLLLGNSSILSEVITAVLTRPEFGYKLVGYLCEDQPCDFPIPCLGTLADVRAVCEQQRPTRVVVGMAERRNRLPVHDLLEVRFGGVIVEDAAAAQCGGATDFLFVGHQPDWLDCHLSSAAFDGSGGEIDFQRAYALPAAQSWFNRAAVYSV